MKELRYLMYGRMPKNDKKIIKRPAKPQTKRFFWHENAVSLCLVPPVWAGTRRLTDYARMLGSGAGEIWIAPELDPDLPEWRQPVPDPGLAAFMLREQPFREILVILLEGKEGHMDKWWQECFLEGCFTDLNGLYLVGGQKEESADFFDWLYEQSGLPACFLKCLPDTDGRRTAVVDLCQKERPPVREIAAGSLYLDLTSDPEKQRILREKRTDISYISARNYLDTAFKARYNAI